jgi:hypothetical protein
MRPGLFDSEVGESPGNPIVIQQCPVLKDAIPQY